MDCFRSQILAILALPQIECSTVRYTLYYICSFFKYYMLVALPSLTFGSIFSVFVTFLVTENTQIKFYFFP